MQSSSKCSEWLTNLLSDRVVDDHGLATDFRAIMRLGELGGHVEAEVTVPLHLLVSQLHSLTPRPLQFGSIDPQACQCVRLEEVPVRCATCLCYDADLSIDMVTPDRFSCGVHMYNVVWKVCYRVHNCQAWLFPD